MTRKTTVSPRSHGRQQCESNTTHDADGEYVFTVVARDHDGGDPESYSVRLDPTEGRWTEVRRRLTQRQGAFAETTARRSSGSASTTTRRASLREDALDSLVEDWYRHDHPSADLEALPAEEGDQAGDGRSDRHHSLFDMSPDRHR